MKKYCVIFGGESPEHDISIITGMQTAKVLKQKYDVEKIYMGLNNKFYLASKVDDLKFFANKNEMKLKEIFISGNSVFASDGFKKKLFEIDCVVNCCHGGVGESGELAGFFEVNKIRQTASNCLASQICMNKSLAKLCVEDVPTIKGVKITQQNFDEVDELLKDFSSNLIVKPNSSGSSIGVFACNKETIKEKILAVFEMNDDALVEERVVDLVEYNQACYKKDGNLVLSAIEQPISKQAFLTFDEKYNHSSKEKGTDRIIPAEISPDLENEIIELTSKIYKTLNINGVARIDYIFDKQTQKLYFNEINSVPGSLSFYLFEPVGVDFLSLLEDLIDNSTLGKNNFYFDSGVLKNKLI